MTKSSSTRAAMIAAEACRKHIHAINYVYEPAEAAKEIDAVLQLADIIRIAEEIISEAKQDTASSSEWQGPTVRVSRSRIKELSIIVRRLQEGDL